MGVATGRRRRPGEQGSERRVSRLAAIFSEALGPFRLTLRPGATIEDLAGAAASPIEGVWRNPCLTPRETPAGPPEPLIRAGRLLRNGAVTA